MCESPESCTTHVPRLRSRADPSEKLASAACKYTKAPQKKRRGEPGGRQHHHLAYARITRQLSLFFSFSSFSSFPSFLPSLLPSCPIYFVRTSFVPFAHQFRPSRAPGTRSDLFFPRSLFLTLTTSLHHPLSPSFRSWTSAPSTQTRR